MLVRHFSEVDNKKIEIEGALGVKKRVLLGETDGTPNFVMRMFSINPGGNTPFHTHNWEHEVYVLSGKGLLKQADGSSDIGPGSVILVLPNEEHGFVNVGEEDLIFLCSIPK